MMAEEVAPRSGPIEGTSRVLRELLRTPRFRKTVNILLSELDPENAGLLVRTIIWEDPEFFLSLLRATPDIANAGIFGLLELSRQLSNFPPGLLANFFAGVLSDLDGERLGEALGRTWLLMADLGESGGGEIGTAGTGFARAFEKGLYAVLAEAGGEEGSAGLVERIIPAVGSAAAKLGKEAAREGSETSATVQKIAEGIHRVAAENPDFIREVVAPLVEAGRQALAGTLAGEGS
jgi:hypothetical protein